MAKEGALDELLAEVLSRYDNSPNPRLKEVTTAAIRHLHAFAREVNLTREEWFAGIMFLTQCGKISDDVRQEFILLSDTTGVSTLVEMLAYDASASSLTDNTVLGSVPRRRLAGSRLRRVDARRPRRRRSSRRSRQDHRRRWQAGRRRRCSTAGRTPATCSMPCSSRASRASSTFAASTTRSPTAPSRSAASGLCRIPSPATARPAIC